MLVVPGKAAHDLHESCVVNLVALRGVAVGVAHHDLADQAPVAVTLVPDDLHIAFVDSAGKVLPRAFAEGLSSFRRIDAGEANLVLATSRVEHRHSVAVGDCNDLSAQDVIGLRDRS